MSEIYEALKKAEKEKESRMQRAQALAAETVGRLESPGEYSSSDSDITIEEYQKNGWHLHTYQAAGLSGGPIRSFVNHYLLFEKDK